jgi:AraC family transcriptional activator of pobA
VKEIKNLRVLNNAKDLYDQLGIAIDGLDSKSEFSIYNLGDFQLQLPYVSPLFRANFFSFVFVKNSRGTSFSDQYTFDIEPGTIYFNNPGYIKHVVLNDVKDLYLATLSESFLKENVQADIFEEFPFLLAENVTPKTLSMEQFSEFEQLYGQVMKEYASDSPYRNKLIGYLFVVILLKIKEYFWNDYDPIREGNRSSQIVKNFKRMLEKHYRNLSKGIADKVFRVQEYAEALNLHPNYLNTVIKSKTGKPVGMWIVEKTIAEAKFLLRNSDISIKEIAYRLGFAESPHFSNYFKKHTKISPVLYRKEHNIMSAS